MQTPTSAQLIALWLVANAIAVGCYDVFVYFFSTPEESVSYVLQGWFRDWPMLAIFFGVLIGHLGWPIRRNGQ